MEDHGITDSEDEENLQMPLATKGPSTSQLDPGSNEKINKTEPKDVKSKVKKSPEKKPKEMCNSKKLKQQQKQEKHVCLLIN